MRVGDAQPFDGAVEREDVGEVPVVEPEAGGGDEDGPVGGVERESEEGEEGEGEGEEVGELHCGLRRSGGWGNVERELRG